MEQGVEAEIAAWLGADLEDPVQRLANDLARSDREFLDELIAYRRRELTQAEVAERMGVSQSAVSQFEAGDRDPQLSTVRRYALAIGVMVKHRVVEPGRAELIRDDALKAVADLRLRLFHDVMGDMRSPWFTIRPDIACLWREGREAGAVVEVDAEGAHLAARLAR